MTENIHLTYVTDARSFRSVGRRFGSLSTGGPFHFYETTIYPDGTRATYRIDSPDCKKQQVQRWLELKERKDKDLPGLSSILYRVSKLFKID